MSDPSSALPVTRAELAGCLTAAACWLRGEPPPAGGPRRATSAAAAAAAPSAWGPPLAGWPAQGGDGVAAAVVGRLAELEQAMSRVERSFAQFTAAPGGPTRQRGQQHSRGGSSGGGVPRYVAPHAGGSGSGTTTSTRPRGLTALPSQEVGGLWSGWVRPETASLFRHTPAESLGGGGGGPAAAVGSLSLSLSHTYSSLPLCLCLCLCLLNVSVVARLLSACLSSYTDRHTHSLSSPPTLSTARTMARTAGGSPARMPAGLSPSTSPPVVQSRPASSCRKRKPSRPGRQCQWRRRRPRRLCQQGFARMAMRAGAQPSRQRHRASSRGAGRRASRRARAGSNR